MILWRKTTCSVLMIFLIHSRVWCIGSCACPDDYEWEKFNGFCYFIQSQTVNYNAAVAGCQSMSSQLTSILSIEEQEFLQGKNPGNVWIGLNDRAKEREFVWVDGNVVSYTNWHPGEPNNDCGIFCGEDCVHMRRENGKWNDAHCDDSNYGYICKRAALPPATTDLMPTTLIQTTSNSMSSEPLISTSEATTSSEVTTKILKQTTSSSWTTMAPSSQRPTTPSTTSRPPGISGITSTVLSSVAETGNPNKNTGNLDTGMIAVISVGAALFILCVIVFSSIVCIKKRKSPSSFLNTGQAYEGPYDLTMEGNESMFIQRNGTVTYKNRNGDVAHNDMVAYENHIVDSDQGEPSGTTDMSGSDTSEKSQTPEHQMSVIYSKPMKRKSGNPDETLSAQTYENQEILSDKKEDHLYEDPCETENGMATETKEQETVNHNNDGFNEKNDEEGWEENSIYSGVSEPEDDLSDDITYEDVTGNDVEVPNKDTIEATYDQRETNVQDSNEEYSEIKDIGGAESTGLGGLHDKDSRSSEGWEDNDMYSVSD